MLRYRFYSLVRSRMVLAGAAEPPTAARKLQTTHLKSILTHVFQPVSLGLLKIFYNIYISSSLVWTVLTPSCRGVKLGLDLHWGRSNRGKLCPLSAYPAFHAGILRQQDVHWRSLVDVRPDPNNPQQRESPTGLPRPGQTKLKRVPQCEVPVWAPDMLPDR